MKKFLMFCAFVGIVFGADYSKMSNQELINLSGKVEPKEIIAYLGEVTTRMEKMATNEVKQMRLAMREARWKAEENLTLKEWRIKNEAICNEFRKAPKEKMTRWMMKMARGYCKQAKMQTPHKAY